MADPKKDSKTDAGGVDPRDAELARLKAELTQLAKAKADAADYAKELETELKGRSGGPEALLAKLAEGQMQLAAAVTQLAKAQAAASTPEMVKHVDTLVDGKVPLAPEHKGVKKYRTTRPGFHGDITNAPRWCPPGTVLTVRDAKPSRHWVLLDGKEKPAAAVQAPAPAPAADEV